LKRCPSSAIFTHCTSLSVASFESGASEPSSAPPHAPRAATAMVGKVRRNKRSREFDAMAAGLRFVAVARLD
jgi:hypothetical protein